MPSVKAEIVQQIAIAPDTQARIAARLSTYQALKIDADLLYEQMEIESKAIRGEMELAGVEKLDIDGTPCTIVRGTFEKLNKLKFVELGGSLEQLENATERKSRKPYLRIGKEKLEAAS